MNPRAEYICYLEGGGRLLEAQYYTHLNAVRTSLGNLILCKDENKGISEVGRAIFYYLGDDSSSKRNFSMVSKGFLALTLDIKEEKIQRVRKSIGHTISTATANDTVALPYSQIQVADIEIATTTLIGSQKALIEMQHSTIKELQEDKEKKELQICQLQSTISTLEESLGVEKNKIITYERDLQDLRNTTHVSINISQSVASTVTLTWWTKAWNAAKSTARQHKVVIEAGILITGGILAIFFPSQGIPIVLVSGGTTKLLGWALP